MFNQNKEVIVVCPEKYTKQARATTHSLSKLSGVSAAFWDTKRFIDNEHQIGAKHYILCIGAKEENSLSKDYLSFIKLQQNSNGICFGYDANKAVIYADQSRINASTADFIKTHGLLTAASTSAVFGLRSFPLLLPLLNPILFFFALKKYFDNQKEKKRQMDLTTLAAVNMFVNNFAQKWLEIEES